MRSYMRDITSVGTADEAIAAAVGMTGDELYEMYRLMAIAKYEDRYVIPKAHVEQAHDLEEMGCSLDFDDGPGWTSPARSARPAGGRRRSRSRPSRPSSNGRPPSASRRRERLRGRVNLLNWDGNGAPAGPVPGAQPTEQERPRR